MPTGTEVDVDIDWAPISTVDLSCLRSLSLVATNYTFR